ncbi:bleomycin resistance protein [Paenibacillus beijingensis]|uniref:Bleomycin resistance protein n=1 Tax=Paenibacillus beijingensis TaxID=1126833 RepID=A0A0D5NKX7_9BACL|nr:VOC family protein [Paenibacillus beijingensis]AJY75780.1 bleomycin resistance protein [Paenibacillus beijingensis]
MKMLQAIPALPVRNVALSADFYRDNLGFTIVHQEDGFAVLLRNDVRIHLWAASDESWRARTASSPVVSGAESFIAGTASCQIGVEGVDELYHEIEPMGILHPRAKLSDRPWGVRDFGVLDPDNNLITFFERL